MIHDKLKLNYRREHSTNFGERKKRLHDYPKFIGPLHELVSPLSHALETSGRSYSGRATRFLLPRASLQLVRAHRRRVCPV